MFYFEMQKVEGGIFETYKKDKKHKTGTHFTAPLCIIFYKTIPLHNPKIKLCTRLFKI